MAEMAGRGIATRRGVMAIHLEPFYQKLCPGVLLPVTEMCSAETMLLPLFPGLTDAEQQFVVESLLSAGAAQGAQRSPSARRELVS